MRSILAGSAVALALFAGSALPSLAASAPPTDFGDLSDGDVQTLTHAKIQGSFTDSYSFNLVDFTQFDVNLSVTAANSPGVTISNFAISVSGPTAVDPELIPLATTGSTLSYMDLMLAPGTYNVIISGVSSGTTSVRNGRTTNTYASYSGPLTVSGVSTVPLPTSVALFGMAVMGVGVAGVVRRKKGASATA